MYLFKKQKRPKNKWHNRTVTYNGIKFDSNKEKERYIFLKKEEDDGRIYNLNHHVILEIVPHIVETREVKLKTKTVYRDKVVQLAINYEADFSYELDGKTVYEDVKGSPKTKTKVYQLKAKLLRALKGIIIKEIYSPTEPIKNEIQHT